MKHQAEALLQACTKQVRRLRPQKSCLAPINLLLTADRFVCCWQILQHKAWEQHGYEHGQHAGFNEGFAQGYTQGYETARNDMQRQTSGNIVSMVQARRLQVATLHMHKVGSCSLHCQSTAKTCEHRENLCSSVLDMLPKQAVERFGCLTVLTHRCAESTTPRCASYASHCSFPARRMLYNNSKPSAPNSAQLCWMLTSDAISWLGCHRAFVHCCRRHCTTSGRPSSRSSHWKGPCQAVRLGCCQSSGGAFS